MVAVQAGYYVSEWGIVAWRGLRVYSSFEIGFCVSDVISECGGVSLFVLPPPHVGAVGTLAVSVVGALDRERPLDDAHPGGANGRVHLRAPAVIEMPSALLD